MAEDIDFVKWKQKRRQSLIGYIVVGSVVGIDYSIILSTLFLYLRDFIKTTHPTVYYCIIIGIFNISSTVFGVISGRWVDKTRKVKRYINIVICLQIIGGIFYAIPYSVSFLIVGRLLAGIGDPLVNVCSGEVVRIYDDEGSTRALWWLASTYSIGFMIGPAFDILFRDIDMKIGSMPVNHLNFVGIFMAIISTLVLIAANLLIHDCSSELDIKENLKKDGISTRKDCQHVMTVLSNDLQTLDLDMIEEETEYNMLIKNSAVNKEMISLQNVVKGLFTNVDAMLLFASTFVFMYCLLATDVLIPLLISELFKWKAIIVTYIFIGYGGAYLVILIIMSKYYYSSHSVYYFTIFSIICQILQFCLLMAIEISERSLWRDVTMLIWFLIFWVVGWCIEEVLIRSMVAKMVPSNIQSFTETLRSGVARLSTILASLSAPLILPYLEYWSGLLAITIFVILICFVVRRRHLLEIREIKFERD